MMSISNVASIGSGGGDSNLRYDPETHYLQVKINDEWQDSIILNSGKYRGCIYATQQINYESQRGHFWFVNFLIANDTLSDYEMVDHIEQYIHYQSNPKYYPPSGWGINYIHSNGSGTAYAFLERYTYTKVFTTGQYPGAAESSALTQLFPPTSNITLNSLNYDLSNLTWSATSANPCIRFITLLMDHEV